MVNIKIFVAFNAVMLVALIMISELPAIITIVTGSGITMQEFYISTSIIIFLMSLAATVLRG